MQKFKEEIIKDILLENNKSSFFCPNFLKKKLKKDVEKFLEQEIFCNIDESYKKLTHSIKGNINPNIQKNINENIRYFIIFARVLQHLRKKRFLNFMSNISQEEIDRSKALYLDKGGLSINNIHDLKMEIDLPLFKKSQAFKMIKHIFSKSKYIERDILLLWLQDIYIDSGYKNYHKELSYLLGELEKFFPELFPRKISHGHGLDHIFKSNINKIRKKITSNNLNLYGSGVAIGRI